MPRAIVAPIPPSVHKMLQHPVRHDIIMRTGERPWCPAELATELQLPLKRIYEQIGILLRTDPPLLEVVEERPADQGGPMVHFYRAVTRITVGADEWDRLSRLEQADQTTTITRLVLSEWLHALEAGTFYEDKEHALMRTALNLDPEGMLRVAEMMIDLQAGLADVERESAERERRGGPPTSRVITLLASFRMP